MSRRTKKVGISGRYGVRYGSSLRRQCRKLESLSRARYDCPWCGRKSSRRQAAGIWSCRPCGKVVAGGAYVPNTPAAITVRTTIRRLREMADA